MRKSGAHAVLKVAVFIVAAFIWGVWRIAWVIDFLPAPSRTSLL